VNRRRIAAAAVFLAACSQWAGPGGPVALEIALPAHVELEVGDTTQLRARALDQQGDSVAATLVWRAGDTTVAVDSLTGRATAVTPSTIGRIQVRSGTLVSDFLTFTTFPRSDTIAIDSTADTTTVVSGDSVSAPLVASLQSYVPAGGVANRRLTFQMVAPTDSSVVLTGDAKTLTVSTAVDGTPVTAVRVHLIGTPRPDSAVVSVSAARPSGTAVPGSGQRFVVYFQP
jgi:hypothetical protein